MTVTDWIQANSYWAALAVSILVMVGLGYYIVKRRRLGVLNIFLMVWGLLLFYYLIDIAGLSKSNLLLPADWAQIWGQILLLGGLLVVTTAYAYSTEKMAEEIKEQRYGTVRPVIDFQWQNFKEVTDDGQGGTMREPYVEVPPELYCKLRNVGFGPAIELYSYTKVGQDNRNRYDFETLVAGGETNWVALSLHQEGSIGVLEAYYRDIYDRSFKSKLEVYPVKGKGLQTKLKVEKV